MFPTISTESNLTTGLLAGGIALTLLLGLGAVFTKSSDDKPTASEQQQEQEEVTREQAQEEEEAARIRAEQDSLALGKIEVQQEECRTRYLPEAARRAEEARQALRELEASNNAVIAQLPPGKAKDTLAAQLPSDVESANAVITAEERSVQTRCQMAFTIFQYTRDLPVPPEPTPTPP